MFRDGYTKTNSNLHNNTYKALVFKFVRLCNLVRLIRKPYGIPLAALLYISG